MNLLELITFSILGDILSVDIESGMIGLKVVMEILHPSLLMGWMA